MTRTILIFIFTFTLLHFGGSLCQAQLEYNFLPEKEAYIQELNRFFDKYGTQNSNDFLKDFIKYADETELEENEWIDIAEISNYLTSKQANPYSYMTVFIKAITSFGLNPDRKQNFPIWSQQVRRLLSQEKKELEAISTFCKFTTKLHEENVLFSSSTFSWRMSAPDYKFLFAREFYVQTGNIDLVGISGRDSSRIQSTSGKFYPFSSSWSASGGKISWEKVGIDNNLVFVRLSAYSLDFSKSVYSLDSVNLFDTRYFNQPILGNFEDKLSIGLSPERSGYPRFSSYKLDNRIKSIFPNMDYQGGYSLEGLKIVGAGIGEQKGELLVFHDNNPFMYLNSLRFVFDTDGAKGLNTSARVFVGNDSIIHPGLFFQYKKQKNELVLMRDGTGSSKSKFFNSFHQTTMDVEMLTWYPGDTLLYLSGMVGTLENISVFESADFFSLDWFNEIQMADLQNPLVLVKKCADFYNSRYYFSSDLAQFMNRPLHLVEEMLLNISYLGFVRFDAETKNVLVLQRTYDFLEQHAGNMDHDIIKFKSNILPPKPNGIINLRSGSLQIFGVPKVELSTSRYVNFQPSLQSFNIEKGRDMSFDGIVEAGLLSFEGSDFNFNYLDFNLNLDQVDIIRLQVHVPLDKNYVETTIVDLSSIIEKTRGVLQIDAPDNKAGIEPDSTPQYPQFRFDTTAYVYYDQKYIQNGAYTRDSFYFEIDPNLLIGLNDIRFREKLFFPGTFYTYNIFPPIELDLVYRKDNSLGFDTLKTPDEGYPVYVDRGTFFNQISMNKSGLRGNGTLTYLGSTIESENFLFLPDRVRVEAETVVVDKNSSGFGNPGIFGEKLDVTWFPFSNSMVVEHLDDPLRLYGNGEFTGKIFVEPESIRGEGTLSMGNYSVTSDNITFMEERFEMEDGRFVIQSNLLSGTGENATSEPDFIANHVSGSVELIDSLAEFRGADGQITSLLFPVNKYKSDQSSFTWDMTDNRVFLQNSRLTSTRKDQDSLSFDAESSVYDINDYTIVANNVPFFDVADVRIYPGTDKAIIRINANLDSLPGCRIVSQDTTNGHEFINSMVNIRGKNNYSATGSYIYQDIAGRDLLLPFAEIGARPGRQSEGKARVDSLSPFLISPEFAFLGNVEWQNQERLMQFNGSFMLTHDCPDITKRWIRFKSKIDPMKVTIPIDSISKSLEGETLHQGFYLSIQPVELYSTFLGPHINYSDHPLISAFGELTYDYQTNQYIIESQAVKDSLLSWPVIKFDKNLCLSTASGMLDMGLDLGQLKLATPGIISHDIVRDSIYTDQLMAIDFFLDDKLLDIFASTINNAAGSEPVNYTRPEYRNSIINWLGRERATELLSELGLMGSFRKIPDEFNHTILLTDLKMKWNQERGSYQSVGKIGIGNINDQPVNKLFNGHIEMVRRRAGDTFTLYIEMDANSYFYFYYNRGLMQVMAGPSYEDFNNRMRDIKPKKRRLKTKSDEQRFEFALGQFRLVRTFLDEINAK